MPNLLIIGARTGSIGEAVADHARKDGWIVHEAGISGEDHPLDLGYPLGTIPKRQLRELFSDSYPSFHAVVCTVGINMEAKLGDNTHYALERVGDSFSLNVLGPLAVLNEWLHYWHFNVSQERPLHFVALSSNSAGVVRSTGLPYNVSKAALSMAMRCVARQVASEDSRISVYCYEPGWVEGTPMSTAVLKRIGPNTPKTRTPGGRVLAREELARMIVDNLSVHEMMNGCCLRIDGGEA